MADSLPMTLRVYQKLSSAIVPLAPALIKRRLKQGKEDPARIGERRGISKDTRPHGPLVWIHGASVGEVLAAAGLIGKLRALNAVSKNSRKQRRGLRKKRIPNAVRER